MKKKLFCFIIIAILSRTVTAQVWSDNFNGLDSITNQSPPGEINPITLTELYNSGDTLLYFGGSFYFINDFEANGVGSWNEDTAKSFQNGVYWGIAYAMIEYEDTLYIGGSFTTASDNPNTARLAVWNGNNWQSTSNGQADGEVRDFCIYHDTLFVAGNFGHIGSLACDKIVAYTGAHWVNVGSFGMYCRALAVFNDELYAGGYWGVRKYLGGSSWQTFPVVPNGQVNELMVDTINSILFVGGQFSTINGLDSWGSAIWDGFDWYPMETFHSTTVVSQSSAMYRGEFYVGNGIVSLEDGYEFFIKKWNGESWDSIGGNFSSTIMALEVFRDTLYIGGAFSYWGGDSHIQDKRSKGLVKLYMPDNGCDYLKPRINAYTDTFYLNGGEVDVNLYNNIYRLVRDDAAGSVEPFRVCVSIRSDWLDALINLGLAQWRTGDVQAAKTTLMQAVVRYPQSTDALRALAALAIELGDANLALDSDSKLEELGERIPELAYNIGILLQRSNLYEDAARSYRRATEEKPNFGEALLNLGHALKALGQEEEARSCWQQAVEAKPELAEQYF